MATGAMVGTWDEEWLWCHSCFCGGGADVAISVRTAENYSQVSGRKLAAAGGKLHGGLVSAERDRGPGAWKKSRVLQPVETGALSKSIADTRWAHTWKDGFVKTAGRVSIRSSRPRAISLGAPG